MECHGRIFEAMGRWEADDNVIEILFGGVNAEDYEVRKGRRRFRWPECPMGVRSFETGLQVIANTSEEPLTVAVATEALLQKWLDHGPIVDIVERCRASDRTRITSRGSSWTH